METRKAQLTGGSTFTVSLPKEWAEENGVEAGRELHLFPRKDGSLIVEPNGEKTAKWDVEVNVQGLSKPAVRRTVHAVYTVGFAEIRLASTDGLGDLQRTITSFARRFVGLEVLETTETQVTLQSLLDPATVSLEQSTLQLEQVTLSMHNDAVRALLQQDAELAEHVVERDNQVDRLFGMVSRHFQRALQSPKETEELELDQMDLYDYYNTTRQLERVADHAEKIADLAIQFEEPVESTFEESIRTKANESRAIVEDASSTVLHDGGVETAYDALERCDNLVSELEALERELHERDVPESHLIALTIDSLTRTAEYGSNIAENALQTAARNGTL